MTGNTGEVLVDTTVRQAAGACIAVQAVADAAGSRATGTEDLSWTSGAGATRTVRTGRYLFDHVPNDWRVR